MKVTVSYEQIHQKAFPPFPEQGSEQSTLHSFVLTQQLDSCGICDFDCKFVIFGTF